MKKLLITLLVIGLAAPYTCIAQVNPKAEKEAIKSVINAEKEAYVDQDLKKIDGVWLQDTTSRKIYTGENGFWEIKGWAALHNENKTNVAEERADISGIDFKFTNFDIVLYDNTAMVYHDANVTGTYKEEEVDIMQKRILHMVKEDGNWKIDLMFMYTMPGEDEESSEDND